MLGLLALSAALFGDALQSCRPFALGFVQQRLKERRLELGNVSEAVRIVFAGEAVIEKVWREPARQICDEAIADDVGAGHCAACCCMAAAMS